MNSIADTIINDARKEASEIIAAAQRDVEETAKRSQEEVRQLKEQEESRMEKQYQQEYERLKAAVEIEAAKYVIQHKQQLMEEVFNELNSKIQSDGELYHSFITQMILLGAQTGKEEIIVTPDDRPMMEKGLLKEASKLLKGKVKGKPSLNLSGDILEGERGIILRDGRVEFDARLSVVRRYLQEQCGIKVAEILFGGGGE